MESVKIFGVLNTSPDSLHTESIATNADEATARVEWLLSSGASGVDIGGQGSTFAASLVSADEEWRRVEPALLAARGSTDLISIDTFRPEVMRRALEAGANVLNAAEGMTTAAAWELAAEFEPLIVVPFMNGPNPLNLRHVEGDPIDAMLDFFTARLDSAATLGLRNRCLLDPGTGFGPHGWEWSERYLYQKHVYSNLDRLRVFDLPLYIPVPWKETAQHDELLEIVMAQHPEFARAHHPDRVLAVAAAVAQR